MRRARKAARWAAKPPMTLRSFSENSNVTIGLAAGFSVVVFWAGVRIGQLETHVTHGQTADRDHTAALATLAAATNDHEVRITAQERAGERTGVAAK